MRERGSSHTVIADLKSDGTRAGESSVMVYLPSEAPCEPASLWLCLPSGVKQQDWTPCPPKILHVVHGERSPCGAMVTLKHSTNINKTY